MSEQDRIEHLGRVQKLDARLGGTRVATHAPQTGRQGVSTDGKTAPPAGADDGGGRVALIEAANTISSLVQNISRELRFSVDDKTGRTVLTVLDLDTDQVIRQIPAEEALEIAEHLQEVATQDQRGILINIEA